MSTSHQPRQNSLLAALPETEFSYIEPSLELITMPLGEVLYESGGKLKYIYFPTTAIVSLLYVVESGASCEIAGIGNEGALGISLIMGGNHIASPPCRAVVRTAGHAYRLGSQFLMSECNRSGGRRAGAMQQLLLRYIQALMTQISQTAICNRYHSIEQQLCRWLLLTLDRLNNQEMFITQELIANMLGVRRESIAVAAGNLQLAGVINYGRGHINILSRKKLESRVCECYKVVKNEHQRLLNDEELRVH